MKYSNLFDHLLILFLGLALIKPLAGLGIPLVIMVKRIHEANFKFNFKFNLGYFLLIISSLWALVVISLRGVNGNEKLLIQYMYLWILPFLLIMYQPTKGTVKKLKILIYVLFALDISFNFYTYLSGLDILGRQVDLREGFLIGVRSGGIFAHSFYSGTISTLAFIFIIFEKQLRWIAIFTIINLILAGSARLAIPIIIIPLFFYAWKLRTRKMEIFQVILISIISIGSVFINSSISNDNLYDNNSNDIRIVAWGIALTKISNSPITGFDYPQLPELDEGINDKTIDEKLIAESWYLNAALTFGIPYLLLRYIGLLLILYGKTYYKRTGYEAIIVPCTLVDLAYGSSFEGLLFYTAFWIIILSKSSLSKLNV